jgi:hypothetical protein
MTALDVAIDLLGKGEQGGNNRGPFVEMVFRGARKRGAWCAPFIAWCLEESGTVPILSDRERRGAKRLARNVADHGRWVIPPGQMPDLLAVAQLPVPGDIIAWHRTSIPRDWRGHIGIVEEFDYANGRMLTIEGNVGRFPAQVGRRYYRRVQWQHRLYGIARPSALTVVCPSTARIEHVAFAAPQ